MNHTYRGWRITRGSYRGTTDDRIDRWYIESPRAQQSSVIDRRGSGFVTLALAREHIDEIIDEIEAGTQRDRPWRNDNPANG